jgi:sigma-E factor negative regulatory protein RseA
MSKESLEHLSSLMDGEVERDSGMFLTRRLSTDDQLCDTWERYHLIRDCIRQPGSKQLVTGLSQKLNAKLEAEDAPSISVWRSKPWLKPVSGLAIAASVALMAVVVATPQNGLPPVGGADTALAQPVNAPFVSPNSALISTPSQAVSFSASDQSEAQRLNSYLFRHNQMARTAGRQGFVSFVPIMATQNADETELTVNEQPAELNSEQELIENR